MAIGGLAAVGLAVTVLLGGATTALAAGGGTALVQADPTPDAPLMHLCYQRAQLALANQANRLTFAGQITTDVQGWIDNLKAQGKDTSSLETALASFQSQIADAQTAHDQAASIMATHAGFDDQGNVTDRAQARDTLHQAATSLRSAHFSLAGASLDLRQAVFEWRQANRPQPQPGGGA